MKNPIQQRPWFFLIYAGLGYAYSLACIHAGGFGYPGGPTGDVIAGLCFAGIYILANHYIFGKGSDERQDHGT